MKVADIVVFSGIPKVLSYKVPESMPACVGARVNVPLKSSVITGVIIEINNNYNKDGLKEIISLCDNDALVPEDIIELLKWTSKYYHASIGSCLQLAFPPLIRKGRDAIKCSLKQANTDRTSESPPDYTEEQLAAIDSLNSLIDSKRFHVAVLHGITGSGKTEVYMAAAVKTLLSGRSVIYMVPEIALTPQTIQRLNERIPFESAVFHSGLSPKKRSEEFMKVASESVRFVIGTRSAIFAPVRNLGLVIVDEEHDQSYKQSDGVAYNARDLAIMRSKMADAVAILGSATPSLETYYRATKENHSLIVMSKRTGDASLPEISVVDMRNRTEVISTELLNEINSTISKHQQVLLFINRRGFSSAIICPGCGKAIECRRCSRALTYHKERREAVCHYCGLIHTAVKICPFCGCIDMKHLGIGTERVVEEIRTLLPEARVLQMDSDNISTQSKLELALKSIRDRRIDIIVGTQMISKGHDFPMLTLVGIIHAEQLMYMPDFRAAERTFQQVVQVSGRAGRIMSGTKVMLQTLVPDHPLIGFISGHDYSSMIDFEAETRRQAGYPPFAFMARCIFSSPIQKNAQELALKATKMIASAGLRILGPSPAPIELLRNTYRWNIVLLSKTRAILHNSLETLKSIKIQSSVKIRIDVDPYDML